jgi:hypothetical protein
MNFLPVCWNVLFSHYQTRRYFIEERSSMLRKRTPNAGVNEDNTVVNDFHRKDAILSTAHAQLYSLT